MGIDKPRWNFRKACWSKFSTELDKLSSLIPTKELSIETCYSRFSGAVFAAAHKLIPGGVRKAYTPCLDDQCLTLLNEYERSGNTEVAAELIDTLNATRRERWQTATSQLDFSHSSRKAWSLIRHLGAAQCPPRQQHPPVSANQVARRLVNVGKAPIDKPTQRQVRDEWRQFLKKGYNAKLPKPFSRDELLAAIKLIKTGTAPGYDNMFPEFLKHCGDRTLKWLAAFFSRVLREGNLPKSWRQSKVIAILKPGKDAKDPASYRPISLLSVCYKLYERLLLERINPLVERVLKPEQAGFRQGRSTSDQVLALTTHIENGFQLNLKTGAVFIDLTSAYDTVWHSGLLIKLSRVMPHWFTMAVEALLHARRFRVHMGNDVSSWREQKNGLPQGSVLAPTLFNLYTNDLPETISRKFIYADDMCCATQARNFDKLEETLNTDVAEIVDYCRKWRLIPNPKKTVTSVFHLLNASANKELTVIMDGKQLVHDPNPVYLGVTLDRSLTYKKHLEKLGGKVKTRNNLLSKLAGSTWGADAPTLQTAALSLCYSAAEYCAPV